MDLSIHFHTVPGWGPEFARRASIVKTLDLSETNPFPGVTVIGRTHLPDGETSALAAQGKVGAYVLYERLRPIYESRSYVYAWEAPWNEPQPMGDATFRKSLAIAQAHWNDLMHRRGWKTVAYNLSVGQPDIGCASDLKPGVDETEYFGVHEYAAPRMDTDKSWLCTRYRRTIEELGFEVPILVTECGIDGGTLVPGLIAGWKTYTKGEKDPVGAYLAQLDWYAKELAKDSYVKAAFVFTANAPGMNPDWQDYELTQQLAIRMKTNYPSIQPVPAPIPVPPPIVVATAIFWKPFAGTYKITDDFADHIERDSTASGLDWALPNRTPVTAAGGAKVVKVGWNKTAGLHVILRHNPRLLTGYRHLSSVCVGTGQMVIAKQKIGESGKTGNATGYCLHFDVWQAGKYIDPEPLLRM